MFQQYIFNVLFILIKEANAYTWKCVWKFTINFHCTNPKCQNALNVNSHLDNSIVIFLQKWFFFNKLSSDIVISSQDSSSPSSFCMPPFHCIHFTLDQTSFSALISLYLTPEGPNSGHEFCSSVDRYLSARHHVLMITTIIVLKVTPFSSNHCVWFNSADNKTFF